MTDDVRAWLALSLDAIKAELERAFDFAAEGEDYTVTITVAQTGESVTRVIRMSPDGILRFEYPIDGLIHIKPVPPKFRTIDVGDEVYKRFREIDRLICFRTPSAITFRNIEWEGRWRNRPRTLKEDQCLASGDLRSTPGRYPPRSRDVVSRNGFRNFRRMP